MELQIPHRVCAEIIEETYFLERKGRELWRRGNSVGTVGKDNAPFQRGGERKDRPSRTVSRKPAKALAVCPNMHASASPGDHIDNEFDARLHDVHGWHVLIGFDQTACSSDVMALPNGCKKTE